MSSFVAEYLDIINEMRIDIDPPDSSGILRLSYVARKYNLTGYDAAFLELARRLNLPLATNDKGLIRAAPQAGVMLLQIPAKT